MIKLKPCPFCGNSEKVKVLIHQFASLSDSYGVECFNCKTQSYQYFDTDREAVEAWNTRAKMEVESEDDYDYERASDMRDYCERYEPTYNPEDGSM